MDFQAVGPVEKTSIQMDRKLSSGVNKVPSGGSTAGQPNDTVSLSQRGQAAVSQQVESSRGAPAGSELRKIDVTDNNQIVVKIVDGQTQRVVRQIPKEEEMRLKQAIQKNLDNLAADSGTVNYEDVGGDV